MVLKLWLKKRRKKKKKPFSFGSNNYRLSSLYYFLMLAGEREVLIPLLCSRENTECITCPSQPMSEKTNPDYIGPTFSLE